MTDHLAHLAHPTVVDAEAACQAHFDGCGRCQRAPGPPPPGVQEADRTLYACDDGVRLHERAVLAAHDAYREAQGGRG